MSRREISEEQLDDLGRLVDTAESSLEMTRRGGVPDHIHVQGLAGCVEQMRDEVKRLYLELGGEDHWKRRPDVSR